MAFELPEATGGMSFKEGGTDFGLSSVNVCVSSTGRVTLTGQMPVAPRVRIPRKTPPPATEPADAAALWSTGQQLMQTPSAAMLRAFIDEVAARNSQHAFVKKLQRDMRTDPSTTGLKFVEFLRRRTTDELREDFALLGSRRLRQRNAFKISDELARILLPVSRPSLALPWDGPMPQLPETAAQAVAEQAAGAPPAEAADAAADEAVAPAEEEVESGNEYSDWTDHPQCPVTPPPAAMTPVAEPMESWQAPEPIEEAAPAGSGGTVDAEMAAEEEGIRQRNEERRMRLSAAEEEGQNDMAGPPHGEEAPRRRKRNRKQEREAEVEEREAEVGNRECELKEREEAVKEREKAMKEREAEMEEKDKEVRGWKAQASAAWDQTREAIAVMKAMKAKDAEKLKASCGGR